MSAGVAIKSLIILVTLLAAVSGVYAQALPAGMGVDSSFRAQYVFGNQLVRSVDSPVPPTDALKIEYSPRIPVLAGTVEVSPGQLFSGRVAGALSILESDTSSNRTVAADAEPVDWRVRPEFWSWEAAGLLHLSSGGGYRFSFTAGYRRDRWLFRGPAPGESSRLRDNFTSSIPFIGLQTCMAFPWWRSRFEVLGSPFMSMRSSHSLRIAGTSVDQQVEADKGGLVEFRMEGSVGMTAACWVGLFASYSYQELYGESVGGSTPPLPPAATQALKFYTRENRSVVGLTVNVVF